MHRDWLADHLKSDKNMPVPLRKRILRLLREDEYDCIYYAQRNWVCLGVGKGDRFCV